MLQMMKIDADRTMRMIAEDIEKKVGDGYGFMVLVFPFSDGVKTANYVSNCRREDMIVALWEKADVLERGLDTPNVGKVQ